MTVGAWMSTKALQPEQPAERTDKHRRGATLVPITLLRSAAGHRERPVRGPTSRATIGPTPNIRIGLRNRRYASADATPGRGTRPRSGCGHRRRRADRDRPRWRGGRRDRGASAGRVSRRTARGRSRAMHWRAWRAGTTVGAVVKEDKRPHQESGRRDRECEHEQVGHAQCEVHGHRQRQVRKHRGGEIEKAAGEIGLRVGGEGLMPEGSAPVAWLKQPPRGLLAPCLEA